MILLIIADSKMMAHAFHSVSLLLSAGPHYHPSYKCSHSQYIFMSKLVFVFKCIRRLCFCFLFFLFCIFFPRAFALEGHHVWEKLHIIINKHFIPVVFHVFCHENPQRQVKGGKKSGDPFLNLLYVVSSLVCMN